MSQKTQVEIGVDGKRLDGSLDVPTGSEAIVIFAHGSGSGRFSPRNSRVAQALSGAGMATLLFDLLTREEDMNYQTRFDIPLLARRLKGVTRWVMEHSGTRGMRIGFFGASTGAAAALQAAAELGEAVGCVVSRGGRPDLAWEHLPRVTAATLLIVGGEDRDVLELNRRALERIGATKRLAVVQGATHLFEEPGKLEEVARLAAGWFVEHLGAAARRV